MTYRPHPEASRRIRSATKLIKLLLDAKSPEIRTEHLRELIDKMLWKITEADGKYKTKYITLAALERASKLSHDHVVTKESLIDALLNATADQVAEILGTALGCTVTREEHARPTKFDYVCQGWERYRKAQDEAWRDASSCASWARRLSSLPPLKGVWVWSRKQSNWRKNHGWFLTRQLALRAPSQRPAF